MNTVFFGYFDFINVHVFQLKVKIDTPGFVVITPYTLITLNTVVIIEKWSSIFFLHCLDLPLIKMI